MSQKIPSFGIGSAPTTSLLPTLNYGLFSQISDSAAITGTDEESLIGSGVGSLSVPANNFKVGDSFHLKMGGLISSANNIDLVFNIKSNGIVLATSGLMNMPQTTNKVWEIEADFVIRSLGSETNASIQTIGSYIFNKDASSAFEGIDFFDLNNTTFNTEIINTLNITAQWQSSDPQNSISTSVLVLSKTY
jgi:hypothetical protein